MPSHRYTSSIICTSCKLLQSVELATELPDQVWCSLSSTNFAGVHAHGRNLCTSADVAPSAHELPYCWHTSSTHAFCMLQVSKLLHYSPVTRMTALGALTHPFFDELRDPNTTLPNGACCPLLALCRACTCGKPSIHLLSLMLSGAQPLWQNRNECDGTLLN